MGAYETTPPATPGITTTLKNQHEHRIFPASDDPPPLAGLKLVRPRRCAAQSREVKSPVVTSRVVVLRARVV
jgi:hypothetical protein